jgi:hypothetical protein
MVEEESRQKKDRTVSLGFYMQSIIGKYNTLKSYNIGLNDINLIYKILVSQC